jgi:hypothetical protein
MVKVTLLFLLKENKECANVIYAPGVKKKILSMRAITNMSCVVMFGTHKFWIVVTNPLNGIVIW